MTEIAIVGAGLGGLCSAIELAADGFDVHVFEAASKAGGKVGTHVVDGIEFDTGPSVLTLVEIFESVFRRGGARMQDMLQLEPTAFRYLWPQGSELMVAHQLEETTNNVRDNFGREGARQFEGFMAHAKRIWETAAPNFIFDEAPRWTTLAKLALTRPRDLARIDPARTYEAAVKALVSIPELQDVLLRYATYNGSDPRSAPATLACIAWVELGLGGYGVRGGMARLVDALVELATSLGVQFSYDTPVKKLLVSRKEVVGLDFGDYQVRPRAVVINADVAHLVRDLWPDAPNKLRPPKEASTSGWTAVLKAKDDPTRAPHTVLFPQTYAHEFRDLFDRKCVPDEPTIYVCDQKQTHGRPGWADASPVFVMVNAPANPGLESGIWSSVERQVQHKLRSAGITHDTDTLVWQRTPKGLAQRFAGSKGSLYGAASHGPRSAFTRPPNRIAEVSGLYLASGSAHPGGGMPLAAQSGRLAAQAIREDLTPARRRSA